MKADNDNGPRLITRHEAATYCGLKPSAFSLWVANGTMPKPVPGTRRWDRRAIDAKLDEKSGIAKKDSDETDLQKWRRERDTRRAQGGR